MRLIDYFLWVNEVKEELNRMRFSLPIHRESNSRIEIGVNPLVVYNINGFTVIADESISYQQCSKIVDSVILIDDFKRIFAADIFIEDCSMDIYFHRHSDNLTYVNKVNGLTVTCHGHNCNLIGEVK